MRKLNGGVHSSTKAQVKERVPLAGAKNFMFC